MTEHHLHGPEVGPVVQQVGRESMPQRVGRDGHVDASLPGVSLDRVPEGLTGHDTPAAAGKERLRSLAGQRPAAVADKAFDPVQGFLANGHQALLAPLAHDPDDALAQIYGGRCRARRVPKSASPWRTATPAWPGPEARWGCSYRALSTTRPPGFRTASRATAGRAPGVRYAPPDPWPFCPGPRCGGRNP